ncbi:thiamine diphosphokinase [Desulfuribacillus stibiiarsenatis]|uniref:Thiamine diphosphokinase n=1 Tax=Desulfuribacillus stibiiarsenatis TaxID=1390249 RepID=A0A1E5L6Z7_9FIRM|nr:thiamine diphosphokinase [Desulfuribacillus stibiiarsenatis]OEH85759.1 thiamine diphosphokinase [Desulfuribacillus stibiiarsenatis]
MENKLIHVKMITGRYEGIIDCTDKDVLIAVDAGIGILRAQNIPPKYLIGDLDSASQEDVKWAKENGVTIVQLEREKDEVDTEVALRYAIQYQPNSITIYNDLDGRFDHAMALVYLLLIPLEKGIACHIEGTYNHIYLVQDKLQLSASHSYVSILPFTQTAKASAIGLKYSLPDLLHVSRPIGISNEFIEQVSEITVEQGIILVILSKIV